MPVPVPVPVPVQVQVQVQVLVRVRVRVLVQALWGCPLLLRTRSSSKRAGKPRKMTNRQRADSWGNFGHKKRPVTLSTPEQPA